MEAGGWGGGWWKPPQPPATGRRQAGCGEAGGGAPREGQAGGRDARNAEGRGALPGASPSPPHTHTHREQPAGARGPAAAPPRPTGGLPSASSRTAASRLPIPFYPQAAPGPGTAFPHPPPFREETFPSQLPAPPEPRCPPRGGGGRRGRALLPGPPPGTLRGTCPKSVPTSSGESPEPAAPAEVTPPLTSQAARLGSARHGGSLGGQRPPGLGANRALPLFQPRDTGAPAPPPAVPPGPCLRSTPVGQRRRDSRLPLGSAGLFDPINGRPPPPSGLCPGRWGRGGRAGRAAQAPAAVPPLRGGGWGLSSPWGRPAVPGRVAPPPPPISGGHWEAAL